MTNKLADYQCKLMLDSGAFSAWTRGVSIDIKEYIDFVKEYRSHLWTYINLDVIPPVGANANDIDEAARSSLANLQRMKKAGLRPVPVFHYREDFKWLERLLEREPYICLGGTVGLKTNLKDQWFNQCFKLVGSGKSKIHGLGLGSFRPLIRYPWQSADFATWDKGGGNGMIPIPVLEGKEFKPNFSKPPVMIKVSNSGKAHLEGFGPVMSEAIKGFLEQSNSSVSEVRYRRVMRDRFWIMYYLELQAYLRTFRAPGPAIKLVFCVSPNELDRHEELTALGVKYRLFSYWEIKTKPAEYLTDYAKSGLELRDERYVNRKPKANWGSAYKNFRALALLARLKREGEDGGGYDSSQDIVG
jgi:hypothetical protein